MELREAMRTTGAVREFTDEPVDVTVLRRVLDDARFAPSGGNRQGWHVIVVEDREVRRVLADRSDQVWRRYLTEEAAGYRGYSVVRPAPPGLQEPDGLPSVPMFTHIDAVPVVLVVTVDLEVLAVPDRDLERIPVAPGASIYPFVHNILLAARGEGLGGVLTTFVTAHEPEVSELLGLPPHHAVAALVGLGHPHHQVRRLRRRPVQEFATVDRYDGRPL